jgi:hypothetical protein
MMAEDLERGNQKPETEFAGVRAENVEPYDLSGRNIDVRNCGSCDCAHQQLTVRPLAARQSHGFTHCYTCPTTGDPVPVALYKHDGSLVEVAPAALRALISAAARGRYMVAVFVSEGETVHLHRTTSSWPTGQFALGLKMLADDIDREVGPPVTDTPMERAERPRPLVDLFSGVPSGDVS